MNLEHFITFQRLAREKSFSETAVSLEISQPTVTLRIKEMEEQVGKLLVHRIGQFVTLTEAGEDFLSYVNRTLRDLGEGKEKIRHLHTPNPPKIRLASTSSISGYLLPRFLNEWNQKSPETRITLCSCPTRDVLHMIKDGIVDIGIVRGTQFDAPLESATLYHDPICLIVNPKHPLAVHSEDQAIPIYQVRKEPIILYRSNAWKAMNKVFLSCGVLPHIVAELSHVMTVKKLVQSGMGIAFLPYSTVRMEINNKELHLIRVIETASISIPTQAVFLTPASSPTGPDLHYFLSELKTFTCSFPNK
jgi:DNA-binding transcriptional LysR family regulator